MTNYNCHFIIKHNSDFIIFALDTTELFSNLKIVFYFIILYKSII